MLGYAYFRFVGEFSALVATGLMSFSAIVQFTPAIIGGIFWKAGTRAGAFSGLLAGFAVWGYTLVLPTLANAGILPQTFVTEGPFGIELLKPYHLFGLSGFNHISHAVSGACLPTLPCTSECRLASTSDAMEHTQANLFVDVFKFAKKPDGTHFWRGTAFIPDLRSLLAAVLGENRASEIISDYARRHDIDMSKKLKADPGMVSHAEKVLAGAIGSSSAHVMVSSVVKEEPLGVEEVMEIIDETKQAIAYSRNLEKITAELQSANRQLKALDSLKDEFVSTVTHELRTPLTAIRALAGIIHDAKGLSPEKRHKFSGIILQEGERLTRLINQVLDFQKIESHEVKIQIALVNMQRVIREALKSTRQLIDEKEIKVNFHCADGTMEVEGDHDRLVVVVLNLLSNAVKFCDSKKGRHPHQTFQRK